MSVIYASKVKCLAKAFVVRSISTALSDADIATTEVGIPQLSDATRMNQTSMYAWSSWGAWSSCSRTCGGGVAVQERQCLPRDPTRWRRSRKRRKLVRSIDRLRRARETHVPDCPGLAKRYHECNTAACPGPVRDSRADQCAVYDRRPFRGRFYTWVPYVDGNSPCTLNCRPRGQQFYASLALVADGTPCTKPGYRAICVQGACKVQNKSSNVEESIINDKRSNVAKSTTYVRY
ncbi:unnamed protein product [Pieris brassicae]|uniref:Papilin n=1 Tax=Pieris brassicae TaxID=7116 RepID=A0A9P0TFD9_PIEBR|nr:unnamed protein product [Pieris brassicae]